MRLYLSVWRHGCGFLTFAVHFEESSVILETSIVKLYIAVLSTYKFQ